MKTETVKKERRNNVFLALKKLYAILNKKQKAKFVSLIVSTFISSLGDLVGLGMVIPIVGLVLSPTFHQKFVNFFPFTASLSKEHLLLCAVGVFFLLIVLKNVFGLYINYLQVKFVRNMFVTSTENVLDKVYKKSLTEIQSESSNTWVNKVTQMQAMLCSNMAISVMIVINEAIVFGLTALIVCLWNWHLFVLLIAILLPTVGLFYYRVKGMIKTAGHEKNNKFIQLYAKAQEMIFGYTDIKIAGTEGSFKKRFNDTAGEYSRLQAKVDFTLFVPTRLIEVAIFLCIIIILLYGVYVIKDINNIVTTITLFSVIAYRSIPSVNRFIIAMNNVNAAEFVLEDEDFMQEETEKEDTEPLLPLSFQDKITFDHVSFRYAGANRNVLNNCNLIINKGDKIGIVGKSGTGKSTLVNNILGFLSPTTGNISVDKVQLNGFNLKNWWKIVGYVRQDAFILNETLAENIALGETVDTIDYAKLEHAIKMSSLTSLISELPNGVKTVLSERGNNLSGGQKQRIAIARAIYKGAQVLVFDEATSALDTKTEEEITDAINELGKENLTIIIIAHRYTSLRFCEKIYQIENGNVSDTFSYHQLVGMQHH